MLKKHISDLIVRQLGFEPTECQIYTIEKLAEFITIEKPFPTFVLNGYACSTWVAATARYSST